MDGLLLASIAFLMTIFCIIAGFIVKLWVDERSSTKSKEALMAMGISGRDERNRSPAANLSAQRANDESDREESEERNEDSDEMADQEGPSSGKKMGKKKLAKLQAKAEAKAQREQEQAEREERKRKAQEAQKQEEEKRQMEEEEERKRAEKRRAEKEERERRELEEYLEIKANFEVQEQGYDYDVNEEDAQNLLEQFIAFIQKKKVVHIDELASNFRSKSEDIVARLETLLQEKRLTGVFDDRGMFTFVSDEELQNVAKFINQRGRVSLVDLVVHSQRLVSLVPAEAENES